MSFQDVTLTIVVGVAAIVLGSTVVHLAWQAIGAWRISRAGPRPRAAIRHVLWRDPGTVETLDITSGPGGADYTPAGPFIHRTHHRRAAGERPARQRRLRRGSRTFQRRDPEAHRTAAASCRDDTRLAFANKAAARFRQKESEPNGSSF